MKTLWFFVVVYLFLSVYLFLLLFCFSFGLSEFLLIE